MNPQISASHPIGIFDSGIGGLTVLQAIQQHLPKESIIYFGDTAHHPYGEKSTAAIQSYAIKITTMLLEHGCKLILIACNSASAAAYELVKEYVGSRAIVLNVIDPTIRFLEKNYAHRRIGLIGTRQTVNSQVYQRKIAALNAQIILRVRTTNLLASAIEEFGSHAVIDALLTAYLTHPDLAEIDALVLACTHYPVIKERILTHYQHKVELIDSSEIVALAARHLLEKNNLLNTEGPSTKQFYLSDYTDSFATNTKLFFPEAIQLKHYPLWD